MDHWLATDEQRDVLVSLVEVRSQLERVSSGDIQSWKWAIIAMASAVNGALTCNLSGTIQVGALREDDAKQTISALQADSKNGLPNNPRLASPKELLKRARRSDKRFERAGPTIAIDSSQTKAFNQLFEFRNAFLHFEPLGWSIETSGMVHIFERVFSIVDQTICDGWSFRHLAPQDRHRLKNVRRDLRRYFAEHPIT